MILIHGWEKILSKLIMLTLQVYSHCWTQPSNIKGIHAQFNNTCTFKEYSRGRMLYTLKEIPRSFNKLIIRMPKLIELSG